MPTSLLDLDGKVRLVGRWTVQAPGLRGRDGGVAAVTFPIVGRHRHGEDDDTVAILDGAPVDVPLHTPAPGGGGGPGAAREVLWWAPPPPRRKRRLAGLFAAAAAGLAVLIALTS